MESAESRRAGPSTEAEDFVRFCYARRRVCWPQLYDEMSTVAARALYRGWGYAELAEHGIRFTLPDLPGLAAVVGNVIRSESEVSRRAASEERLARRSSRAPASMGAG